MQILLACCALGFFVWLLIPDHKTGSETGPAGDGDDATDPSAAIGIGEGLLGGDIEDAAVVRYALDRTPKDPTSTTARGMGTALGIRHSLDS